MNVAVAAQLGAGARGDIQHTAEAVDVFRGEATSHEVYGFKNLRADAGRKLRLSVVQKGDAVDEFVEGKLRATHGEKIVVAVAGPGHEVVDEVVGAFEQWLGGVFGVLARGGGGAAGFFRGGGQIGGVNFHR